MRGADLQDVRVLGNHLDLPWIQDLRDDRQSRGRPRFGQKFEALDAHALEAVGRTARLVGAAAQNLRAHRGDVLGGGGQLLAALDRAWSCHDGYRAVADRDAADENRRALARVAAGGQLEGFADWQGGLHVRHAFQLFEQFGRTVADDRDYGFVHAAQHAGFQALGADARLDGGKRRLAGGVLHHDDHLDGSSN